MFRGPPAEARLLARDEACRLRERTRDDLLLFEGARVTRVVGPKGAGYDIRFFSFLDTDDSQADLYVEVRVRSIGMPFARAARAGFVVDDESQVWDRGSIIGRLPSAHP